MLFITTSGFFALVIVRPTIKIFEPFFRLESHRNRDQSQPQGGYGLGLAIVKRICQWHKGNCLLSESTLGGCKFIIELPNNEI